MTTVLEHVNAANAKSASLPLRVLKPVSRKVDNKDMEIFSCRLVSSSGFYATGEATLWGTDAQREKVKKALEKKFVHNQVYTFSKLAMNKKERSVHFRSTPVRCQSV